MHLLQREGVHVRIIVSLVFGGLGGWATFLVIESRRRHDRINNKLTALKRLYDQDRNPSMGPQ